MRKVAGRLIWEREDEQTSVEVKTPEIWFNKIHQAIIVLNWINFYFKGGEFGLPDRRRPRRRRKEENGVCWPYTVSILNWNSNDQLSGKLIKLLLFCWQFWDIWDKLIKKWISSSGSFKELSLLYGQLWKKNCIPFCYTS